MALVFINTKDEKEKILSIEKDVRRKVNASILNKYVIYEDEVRKITGVDARYYYGEFDIKIELEGLTNPISIIDYEATKDYIDKFGEEFGFPVYSSKKAAEKAKEEKALQELKDEENGLDEY